MREDEENIDEVSRSEIKKEPYENLMVTGNIAEKQETHDKGKHGRNEL